MGFMSYPQVSDYLTCYSLALCYYLSIAISKLYMKLRIQNLNPIKVQSKKVTKGKLNQKAMMRDRGIPTWNMMLLAAKGI